jgi:heme-degrading monooxygenase HmoA
MLHENAQKGTIPMYMAIRRYAGATGTPDEIGRGAQAAVLSLQEVPGFVSWYLLDAGDGNWASVSIFDSRSGAEESTRIAVAYVRQHLAKYFPSPPEVTVGVVAAHGTRSSREGRGS